MRSHSYARTIDLLYAAAVHGRDWPAVLSAVADYVGAEGAMLVRHDFVTGKANLVVGRLRADLNDSYMRDHAANPLAVGIAGRSAGRPAVGSSILSRDRLRRTALYADIFAPQKLEESVSLPHASLTHATASGGLGVVLNARQAEAVDTVAARLGRLAPHIARAIDLMLDVEASRARLHRLEAMAMALPTAAFILLADGLLLEANAAGEALLAKGDCLRLEARRLTGATAAQDAVLARLRHAALSRAEAEAPARLVRALPRGDGRPACFAIATPLPPLPSSVLLGRDAGPCLLLQLADPTAPDAPGIAALQRGFGLTSAEARVAALVGAGLSAPQAAARLKVSAATTRTHLAHVFDKLGIRSQRELVRLCALLDGGG
ncbi:helix-turn-helix transcriptional regulator [Sandaracinobacter sp. RS1-74]|uniref:helix-turn-helix transcriptional regulator n=1 Tax=Sandaracinobacteroides sayramensis TaxID=2913411 RepID=UPI001EDAB85A|nr:helix-turn-helix transcriptional regulator [Sandaracinobacteroides sayramensis]MCG2840391.1 helix-turn-helix transcriptional regulator [Sandaracinobacteroides sayramensis]